MKNPSAAEDSGVGRTGVTTSIRSDGETRSTADDLNALSKGLRMLNDVDSAFDALQSSLARLSLPGG